MTTTLTLATGWLETDFPYQMHDPADWTWTQAVAIFDAEPRGGTIEFDADLIGRTGTLTATVQTPNTLNEVTQAVRQYAPIPSEGDTLILGTGTLRLRERATGGMTPSDWDDTRYPLTVIGLRDAQLNGEAMRTLFCQTVALQLTAN